MAACAFCHRREPELSINWGYCGSAAFTDRRSRNRFTHMEVLSHLGYFGFPSQNPVSRLPMQLPVVCRRGVQ